MMSKYEVHIELTLHPDSAHQAVTVDVNDGDYDAAEAEAAAIAIRRAEITADCIKFVEVGR